MAITMRSRQLRVSRIRQPKIARDVKAVLDLVCRFPIKGDAIFPPASPQVWESKETRQISRITPVKR
jgi:hypothetical protein